MPAQPLGPDVTGAGVVSLGSKKKRLGEARIVKFTFKAPNTKHKLKLKLKFVPVAGSISRRTVKIRFSPKDAVYDQRVTF